MSGESWWSVKARVTNQDTNASTLFDAVYKAESGQEAHEQLKEDTPMGNSDEYEKVDTEEL